MLSQLKLSLSDNNLISLKNVIFVAKKQFKKYLINSDSFGVVVTVLIPGNLCVNNSLTFKEISKLLEPIITRLDVIKSISEVLADKNSGL